MNNFLWWSRLRRLPVSYHRQVLPPCSRLFSTSRPRSKKDFHKEEKLPVFDYGKIHGDRKRLYVFGQAGHGGLGLDTIFEKRWLGVETRERLYMHRPVRHSFGDTHPLRDIATGHGFTLFAVKPRDRQNSPVIFGCGYNHKSQLGFQPSPREKPMTCLISPVPLALPLDKTSKVLALGCGRAHSVISVQGKGLITLGDNSQGQCGRKIIPDEEYLGSKYICRVPPMGPTSDDDIIQITTRFDVNICLSKQGKVYTFGSNLQGQLGRGKDIPKPWIPAQVAGDIEGVRITKVVTSGSSVLAISDKGQLFGWGCNDCGQVNPETLSNIYYEPVHIKLPRRIGKLIDVAIGDMFTFLVNDYGNVYVWGTGGSMGMGPKNVVIKKPLLMPPPLFGRNEFNTEAAVVKIVCSGNYSAAVNSVGDLYMWGKSDNGCMGLGKMHKDGDYQYFPLKVPLGGPVHKVCLGADHTVVMTKAAF